MCQAGGPSAPWLCAFRIRCTAPGWGRAGGGAESGEVGVGKAVGLGERSQDALHEEGLEGGASAEAAAGKAHGKKRDTDREL